MTFKQLGLCAEVLRALESEGYTQPTPIQRQAIPAILDGQDVLAGAQTGTGKTAAFAAPILDLLSESDRRAQSKKPRALVLTPTRELASQVEESFRIYGKGLGLRSTVIFGGVGINPQIKELRRGVDILVATPGRLLDHAGQGTVDFSDVEILVLDEADRMLDMGFIHDIRRVMQLLPERRQSMLFSATYSNDIRKLASTILYKPEVIEVARRNTAAETVNQIVYKLPQGHKRALLSHLISDGDWDQVLVFTRTKHGANRLAKQLGQDGITATAIHGNKSQAARTRALADFKAGRVRALVATDVASRGLDIDMLPHVVNYEIPNVSEDYVHRIGRTGRAGSEGTAISFVSPEERDNLRGIEKLLRRAIEVEELPDFKRPAPKPQNRANSESNSGNSAKVRRPRGSTSRRNDSRRGDRQSSGQDHQGRNNSQKRNPGRSAAERPEERSASNSKRRKRRPGAPNPGGSKANAPKQDVQNSEHPRSSRPKSSRSKSTGSNSSRTKASKGNSSRSGEAIPKYVRRSRRRSD